MQGMTRGVRWPVVLLTMVTIFMADTAAAKRCEDEAGWRQRVDRAKRLIVTVLGRFSNPPGKPVGDTIWKAPDGSTATARE
jgi:hypothetical protein